MQPFSLKTKIVTAKLAETRSFYETLFGLVAIEEWNEPGDVGCILAFPGDRGGALLEIYLGQQAADYSGIGLQFRTTDLLGFQRALPENLPVRGPIDRPWGSRYLFLTDPNGIAVVVYEGGF